MTRTSLAVLTEIGPLSLAAQPSACLLGLEGVEIGAACSSPTSSSLLADFRLGPGSKLALVVLWARSQLAAWGHVCGKKHSWWRLPGYLLASTLRKGHFLALTHSGILSFLTTGSQQCIWDSFSNIRYIHERLTMGSNKLLGRPQACVVKQYRTFLELLQKSTKDCKLLLSEKGAC